MWFAGLSLLSLTPIVLAAPAADSDASTCHPTRDTKVARYDDLPFVEPGPNPIPPHYLGLSYTLFQVDHDGFIPPTSGNQRAMAYGGSGNISIPADSPPNQTFDLDRFSYACVAGIPQPECAISVWGWKPHGRVIKRVINFPRLDPGHFAEDFKMNSTSFGAEWNGLRSVGFSIARADNGGDMYGGLALDDVKYTIKKQC